MIEHRIRILKSTCKSLRIPESLANPRILKRILESSANPRIPESSNPLSESSNPQTAESSAFKKTANPNPRIHPESTRRGDTRDPGLVSEMYSHFGPPQARNNVF